MTLYTIELTPSGNGFVLNPNMLLGAPGSDIDYRLIKQPLNSIIRIVLEENEADGINIIFVDGVKVNLKKEYVSKVGTVESFPTNEILLDSIVNLLGW
jgi:hypothetical protein